MVFKATLELGMGDGNRASSNTQSWLFFPRFSSFSCINTPWIVASLWLISSVRKVCVHSFADVLIAFLEKWIFRAPCANIPAASLLTCGIFDSASVIVAGMHMLVSFPQTFSHQFSRLFFFNSPTMWLNH